MKAFTKTNGLVAPLDRVNVDTDQICPAVFLKRITRTGYEDTLFHSWRFLPDGSPNPKFELNAPRYQGSSILVAGRNFGSGSSREHAVWALMDYGFQVVIAPSFAEIFHRNALEAGLVTAIVPEESVSELIKRAKRTPGYKLSVDLEKCRITDAEGYSIPFVVHTDPQSHDFRRHCLVNGLDEIGLTLQQEDKIKAYEERVFSKSFS